MAPFQKQKPHDGRAIVRFELVLFV